MLSIQQPTILGPGEGKKIAVGHSTLVVKLPCAVTGDALSMTEYELAANFPGPPPHKHKVFEHAWYILEGELNVTLDESTHTLTAGSFIYIPKRTVHAFANTSQKPARVLVVDIPGGFEQYYDDLEQAFGNGQPIDHQKMRDIQLRYDTFPPDQVF